MTDNAATSGFDRRSLIKKGLVGAGVAATAPVILTFNAAAFAASIPGCHTIQYKITPQNPNEPATIVVEPNIQGCLPTNWEPPDGTINPFITAAGPTAGNIYTFTLDPNAEGCTFFDAAANKTAGDCVDAPGPAYTGIGTTVLTFDRDSLGNDQGEFHIRLVICCPP